MPFEKARHAGSGAFPCINKELCDLGGVTHPPTGDSNRTVSRRRRDFTLLLRLQARACPGVSPAGPGRGRARVPGKVRVAQADVSGQRQPDSVLLHPSFWKTTRCRPRNKISASPTGPEEAGAQEPLRGSRPATSSSSGLRFSCSRILDMPGFKRILTVTFLALCLPSPGNAQQQCTNGFDLDRQSGQCVDIDECRTIPEACRGDMMCVNQNGGYLCIPRTNPVYRGPYSNPYSNPYSGPYPAAAPPLPAPNYPTISRPLMCRFGFQMDEGNQCVDVDECATDSHQCNPTQICINTEGGYTCSCTDGYWLLEGQCLDIDECRYGYCQQLCANVPGSYSCTCNPGFTLNEDGRSCQDVNECAAENPCVQTCVNTYGSFICRCDPGYELEDDGVRCSDMDECSFSEFLCQHECVNQPGTYFCSCPPGYILLDDNRSCQDINECEHRNHTCTLQQTCYNVQGGFKCIDPIRCEEPYLQISDNRCMCPAENPGCRDQPFTILYRDMDVVSGRSVPADIFQMQATTRYPGAYYIFQIKSGNEGREFYMRQTGPISATLVMTRPIKGPRDIELDLEMITVNTVINFRGSSVIRLRIHVSQYPF